MRRRSRKRKRDGKGKKKGMNEMHRTDSGGHCLQRRAQEAEAAACTLGGVLAQKGTQRGQILHHLVHHHGGVAAAQDGAKVLWRGWGNRESRDEERERGRDEGREMKGEI